MSKYVHTEVEGRQLKLSNLDKTLYPGSKFVKAEIIQYYMRVAPLLLKYIGRRPLTLIRYPDGIDGTKFYSKTCPDWAPKWIQRQPIQHSEESVDYAVINTTPGVVWLANLAALELHPTQMTTDRMDNPDHFIFDLDPPEGQDFERVKEIAFQLKTFLERYNYTPFVKTSGGKGVHILVPIFPEYTHEEMVETVKGLAKQFVQQNKETSTLQLQKGSRAGKTLIDIYRNHMAQTTVSAYSMRAKPGAPISTPIQWDHLRDISSSQAITLSNIDAHIEKYGDVWAEFENYASPLHDRVKASEKFDQKMEERLRSYREKRNFSASPEPQPLKVDKGKDRFCIQLHDASNLHYDLRLEEDGVLMSWAIPKGLPIVQGVKRLAIQTEDHPMEYLTFEGTIPKGEYGAGQMWVFALGKIKWIKKTEDKSYHFTLNSKQITGEYKLYKTGNGNQWLIERKDVPASTLLDESVIKPQLADVSKEVPVGHQFSYEIKWDGIRTIIFINDGKVRIQSRAGRDITDQFPELQEVDEYFDIEHAVFDGEIISMDDQGRPVFADVISRLHTKGKTSIERATKSNPAYCYLYDCLYLDGRDIIAESLERRQAWLGVSLKKQDKYRLSEPVKDGQALFEAAKAMNLEGIMAKDKSMPYELGRRNTHWLKVKFRETLTCHIIGYTEGKGDRSNLFGSLHIAQIDEQPWNYLGKVGTGFDESKMIEILAMLQEIPETGKIIEETIEEAQRTVWIEPRLICEVKFASYTSNGTLREPVFMGLRTDLT